MPSFDKSWVTSLELYFPYEVAFNNPFRLKRNLGTTFQCFAQNMSSCKEENFNKM